MLAGYLPFDDDPSNPDGDNINQLYNYILVTTLVFPDHVSSDARDLMRMMLVPDPAKRSDMRRIMGHRWLRPYAPLFQYSIEELEVRTAHHLFMMSISIIKNERPNTYERLSMDARIFRTKQWLDSMVRHGLLLGETILGIILLTRHQRGTLHQVVMVHRVQTSICQDVTLSGLIQYLTLYPHGTCTQ